jgi:hypothetical protein
MIRIMLQTKPEHCHDFERRRLRRYLHLRLAALTIDLPLRNLTYGSASHIALRAHVTKLALATLATEDLAALFAAVDLSPFLLIVARRTLVVCAHENFLFTARS